MLLGYLICAFPVVAVVSLFCYLPVLLYDRKQGIRRPFIRHLTIYTLLGVLSSILYLTIFWGGLPGRFPVEYRFLNLRPLIWITEPYEMGVSRMIGQLLTNLVMFVPMGLFLAAVFPSLRRWQRTVALVGLFVLCIETTQYFIGRSADIDDWIMNTAGGWAGYGLYCLCDRCFRAKNWWKNAVGTAEEEKNSCAAGKKAL